MAKHKKPNIVFISVDDMNYDSIGKYNNPSFTPNIDKLLQSGTYINNFHVTVAVCQPSRQCIMTGLYPHNNKSFGFSNIGFKIDTLQEILSDNGYINGIISKVGHLTPIHKYNWSYIKELDNKPHYWGRNPKLYYDYTKEFITQFNDKPFFLMANINDPHRPFCNSDQEKQKYGINTKAKKYYKVNEIKPLGFLPELDEIKKETCEYYNSVTRADDSVGEIIKALNETNTYEDSIIIFLSDNGMAFPFAKTNCYLNSTKVPFVIKWKDKISPDREINDALFSGIDIMPTLLDLIDIKYDKKLDGKSFANILLNKDLDIKDRNTVFTLFNANFRRDVFEMRCVINENYGYIFNDWANNETEFFSQTMTGRTFNAMLDASKKNKDIKDRVSFFLKREKEELYDLKKDPNALNNLINDKNYKTKIKDLKNLLIQEMTKSNDPLLERFKD